MPKKRGPGTLREIPVKKIDRNPDNPRLYFRQNEVDDLTESIRRHGVQVPIAVYKEAGRYVLIDGERRWRCSLRLNKKEIPAIIQKKPTPLENLTLMFNIHALREQWDLFTIALKLPLVVELYAGKHGHKPNERELSEETGLNRSTIRRSRLLMDLPKHHRDNIAAELRKPKARQRITEDFYIEMERALTVVSKRMPDIIGSERDKERARQVLLRKFRDETIKNRVNFRMIAKMARPENVDADPAAAKRELRKVFRRNRYSILDAFEHSVSEAYLGRDIATRIKTLIAHLSALEKEELDPDITPLLTELVELAKRLLGGLS